MSDLAETVDATVALRARPADFAKWGQHTTNVTVIMLAERIYQRVYAS